ncbi:MAG: AAA family ATPase [Promethearchaeota archaeon]
MKVFGFCGLPGSGKTTAIMAIKDLGEIITMGDVIRQEARRRGLEPTNENLGKLAIELRIKNGEEFIAEKCVELIKKLNNEIVFIDGIRSISELKVFRKYWKFPLIAIKTKKKIRYKRIINRSRSDDSRIIKQIKQRDKREINLGLKKVIKKSDYVIYNNNSEEELKKKVRTLILKLMNSKQGI